MTYEELAKANERLKTVDIKGKDYVQVNYRILAFRELFPMGTIRTEILHIDIEQGVVMMQATAMDETGKVLGTGMAYEEKSSSYINKGSYIENCETSAVGRALAMLGIGVDASICSAEELVNAVTNQDKKPTKKTKAEEPEPQNAEDVGKMKIPELKVKALEGKCKSEGVPVEKICTLYKVKTLADLNERQFSHLNLNWEKVKAM